MRTSKDITLRLITLLFVCCALAIWLSFGNPSASFAKMRDWAGFPVNTSVAAAQGEAIGPKAKLQIQDLINEKLSRTPAQRKLDSQLVYATKMKRGLRIAANVQTLEVPFSLDRNDVEVDITAKSTDALVKQITASGGTVINVVARYGAVRAIVNFNQLETLAALPDVMFIQPKQEFMTSGNDRREMSAQPLSSDKGSKPSRYALSPDFPQRAARVRSSINNLLAGRTAASFASPMAMFIGSVNSQGDVTHKADLARGVFGINGSGVKIGVMSNGVVSLATSQTLGDLGAVTVLPGQTGTGDEGTAMLEIIRDLAPGAQLYFATANPTIAQFAQNIRDLRTAGCDIIVDDVFYFVETPFQDGQLVTTNTNGGVVIQAVNDVTASGAMYFSSAGNSGNKNDSTSGVWEGNFVDGGPVSGAVGTFEGGIGRVHDFGGQTFNVLTVAGTSPIGLYWSDPLGGSANDYDIVRLNAAGTSVLASGANFQNGTQDPYEQITATGAAANQRIVIVQFSGAARFLHLNTNRGQLSISTNGTTHGHSHAANAFSVAATPSGPTKFNSTDPAGPFPGTFNSANVVETFTSDGPRRIFYNADGTAITPGNVLATGGTLRQKPDITAADGTAVTGVGGFGSPFFGTSAAAPHAAAIAGLIKSAGSFTNAQIRTALISTAIDIEGAGVDRDSGAGIIMALEALKSLNVPGNAFLSLGTVVVSEVVGNGNGVLEPGETGALTLPLNNVGVATATNVLATLSTTTPGITLIQGGPQSYGNIAANGMAINPTSYTFTVASNFPCNGLVNFTLTTSYGGGLTSTQALGFQLQIVGAPLVITETLNPTPPVSGAIYTATGGTQNNRLNRNGVISSCGAPKTTPTLQEAGVGTAKRFDAFTLTNPSPSTNCITVTLSSACNAVAGSQLYLVAYNNNGFVPTAIQTNYLADRGVTTLGDQTISFNVPGNANFTVVVHEITAGATNTSSCPYTLTISGLSCPASPVCAPITVNPATLNNGTIGTPYNAAITATSSVVTPYTFSVTEGTLPPGLTLNSTTGVLSGTPTTAGNYNFRVSAQAGVCLGFRDYSLTVACPTTALSPASLPAGTSGNAYSQTLSVTPAGTYNFSLIGGSLPAGLTLNSSTGLISGTPTSTGSATFTVKAEPANGCSATIVYTLAINCPTITVNPASLPNSAAGTAYSQTISATPAGGNYTYAVTSGSLPTGLNLNSSTGLLTGTPSVNGTYNFSITATGFGPCASAPKAYTIVIGGGGCPIITLPASLPSGTVGQLYGNSVAASPADSYNYSVSVGALPPGLTLFGSFGLIFGYPTAPGSYTFTITATLGACTASQQYTVVVDSGVVPAVLQEATIGKRYTQHFMPLGASSGVNFSVASGKLPEGISLTAAGALSGTPSETGNFPFTLQAADAFNTALNQVVLKVNDVATPVVSGSIVDPLNCTRSGSAVNVSATVSNTSGATQTATFTATLPAQLLALPGSCATNVAGFNCSVTNASTVTATGTLTNNQSVTIIYQAQIADGVQAGAQVCVTSTASFAGAGSASVQACTTLNCPTIGVGSQYPAASLMSDQKAGSVLIYNIYTSATDPTRQNTRLSITNTDPARSISVHLFFVDGSSCSVADSYLCLTQNQTASFLASDLDPGTTGYVVAIATDANGCPTNFNFLIGDEYVKFSSGHAANLAAEAIAALPGGLVACNTNSTTAAINFDGISYNTVPRVLAVDNVGSRADGNDTLLILNRIGGNLATGASTLGTVFGILYDDSESGLSFSLTGSCQLRNSLSNTFPRTTPRFENFIPAGRSGWLKVFSQSDIGLSGSVINFNPNAGTTAGAFNQGHNLHILTGTAAMSYTIPVFPPGC